MDVAVLDRLSGKSSAKRIPFEIADDTKAAGPVLSDMVLVRKMDAYDEDSDPTEPLRYEKAKVTPNLVGLVPHDAKQISMSVSYTHLDVYKRQAGNLRRLPRRHRRNRRPIRARNRPR